MKYKHAIWDTDWETAAAMRLMNGVSQWSRVKDQHTHTHTPARTQMSRLTQTQQREQRDWITWGHRYVMMMVMKAFWCSVLWFFPETERPWITAMKTLRYNNECVSKQSCSNENPSVSLLCAPRQEKNPFTKWSNSNLMRSFLKLNN